MNWIRTRKKLEQSIDFSLVRVVYGYSCMCNASVIHPPIISREHACATVMRKLPMFLVRGKFETSIWILSKITQRREGKM